MSLGRRLGPLQEPSFRLFFLARTTSGVGNDVATIAFAFAVLDLTGSASSLGLGLLARTVPDLAVVPLAGVLADRLPRRRLLVASDLGRGILQAVLAGLLLSGRARFWEIVVLQIAYGAFDGLFHPTAQGLTPAVVSAGRLQQANALLSLSVNTTMIVGPALGGVLVATIEPGAAIAVDAASFLLSAALFLRLRLPAQAPIEGLGFLALFLDGWRIVRVRTWLLLSLAGDGAFQFLVLSSLFVLGPVIARRDLGGAGAWAAVVTALGVGSLLGDAVSLRVRPARPLLVCRASVLSVVPGLLALAFALPLPLIVVAFVCGGVGFSFSNTLWFTLLQEGVPEQARSRVAAFDILLSRSLLPAGYAAVGFLAGGIGAGLTMAVATVAMAFLQIATLLAPSVRQLRRPELEQPPGSYGQASGQGGNL
jgi:hypothetical protein